MLSLLEGAQQSRAEPAEVPTHPWRAAPGLTLHELHDNVNGLFLGADANEAHDVRVAVLLQDPGGHRCLGSHLGGLDILPQPQGSPGNPRELQGTPGNPRKDGKRAAKRRAWPLRPGGLGV